MKRPLLIISVLLALTNTCLAQNSLTNVKSWICFYGASFPSKKIPDYDLYIFNKTHHPDLLPIKQNGGEAVGYVSAGEISKTDPYFDKVPAGLLIEENINWKGSYRVDLRSRKWQDMIVNEMVPSVLKEGFDGVFIDTIDVAQYLEKEKGMKGSINGAISLIKKIRKKYGQITIVLNNGLFLADKVGGLIDALVVEDVYTLYDFKEKKYETADLQWTKARLDAIEKFRQNYEKPVLSLDYMDGTDIRASKLIADRARSDGLIPYISDIELKMVFFHP